MPLTEDHENEIWEALPEPLRARFDALCVECRELADKVETIEGERDDAKAELEAADAEQDETTEVLEAVKYWFHDVMVLGKPMSDPRVILRKVESVL